MQCEVGQILKFEAFRDGGAHKEGQALPAGHKMIRIHFVFDVKADGRRRARLVCDGDLTSLPLEAVHSGVVTLRSIRLIAFIAEPNGLKLWGADIGSAYLESHTSEKACIVGPPEFGDLAGHSLFVERAVHGLRSSGLCWHRRFAAALEEMGFFMCRADTDVWMRDVGDHCECIGVCVDDLQIASKNPEAIVEALEKTHKFALRGSGPLTFHLGCDFGRDEDGALHQSPTKCIERMSQNFARLFGQQPKAHKSPLEKNDHPELDDSPLLDAEGVKQHQSLIGSSQWAVSLARFDIACAVCTLSAFRVAPRQGHLDRAKRVVGCLVAMKHGKLRHRTGRPDFSGLEENGCEWTDTPCAKAEELTPDSHPPPKGKTVDTMTFTDANLLHDLLSGKAMAATQHCVNQTPIDATARKQSVVETSTHGSELAVARLGTEQIMDLRTALRHMGAPVGRSVMFGDNASVIQSTTVPHSKLNKRHTAPSHHRVREAIAAQILSCCHVPGEINPADILSEHWGHQQVWPILKAAMFWHGDTMDAFPDEDKSWNRNGGE